MRFASVLAAAAIAWGLATAPATAQHAQGFRATVRRTGTQTRNEFVDCPGHKSKLQSVTLAIEVTNMQKQDLAVDAQWYFVAQTSVGKERVFFDSGRATLNLKPGGATNRVVQSQPVHSHKADCAMRNIHRDAEFVGYIVRCTAPNSRPAVVASVPSLQAVGEDEAGLARLVASSAEWRKRAGLEGPDAR